MYFMTIDAGTGSARAVIFDTLGNQVAIAQREWVHLSEEGIAHSMGFDYEKNWQIIITCIKEAVFKAGIKTESIAAISATSMREGIILYDRGGNELFGVANVDARAMAEVADINTQYPHLEKEFYDISGQTFALGALPRLLWVKRHKPDIYEKTAFINMISDWVLTKLSGVIASEPSNTGTSGVFSLKTRQWEPEMAKKLGLKEDIFPPVYETGTVIATVSQKASELTGLHVNTKVVMGGGDVQLGSAGLGVVKADQCAILGGTFWQQIVNIDGAKVDPQMNIRINPHVIPGLSQAEGITFFSGMVMRWFRDTFCEMEKISAQKQGIDAYEYLENLAKEIPLGSYGIMPIFSDTMKYSKWYHAAPSFLNLSLENTSKAAMFRALEENAAIVSMLNLNAIFEFTQTQSDSITFAGGAAKGDLWSQILSDVTCKEIRIPKVTEATALGGAFAAGVGAGEYTSIAEAAESLVKWEKSYEPNKENFAMYQEQAQKWQESYAKQLELVDRGITTSMWKAPGL
jgi:autoinducer 2 (AI-2) kinase